MAESQKLLILAAAAAGISCCIEEQSLRNKKRYWIRPFLRNRKTTGDFFSAVPQMIREDPEYYFETFRVTPSAFEELLGIVGSYLQKQEVTREPVSAAERLQLTLAYLVSGDQQKSIAKNYRLGRSTVCNIIHETTEAIYKALQPAFLKTPQIKDWSDIADGFLKEWQFPNCIGSIDGKHFAIPQPANSGTTYYNYKGFFSVVMLATCDAYYNFTTITVGSAGSESDAGIFRRSILGRKLLDHTFPLPAPAPVPGTPFITPFTFVGDEAFPLLPNLMRPYPGAALNPQRRIFNYRLSRARRIIENTFGILVARWRILADTIYMKPEYAVSTIQCCVTLHNYVRSKLETNKLYCPSGFVDWEDPITHTIKPGAWRNFINESSISKTSLEKQSSNNYAVAAAALRDKLTMYFNGVGAVEWQEQHIFRS